MSNISDRLRIMLHHIFSEAKDVSSNREISISCPLCAKQGDPDNGRHMYISLGLDNKPPMYNCFRRTGHSGLLTRYTLEQLSNYSQYIDTALMDEIENYYKAYSNYGRLQSIREQKVSLIIPDTKKYEYKLDYLSTRLGIELNIDMCRENKIILSLYEFLHSNYIYTYTMDKRSMDKLDKDFIGFLTNTGTSIIMRNLTTIGSRYIKYNVIDNPITSYYILPSEIDIYKPIEAHIAEGPFDILSIFYNLMNGDRKNKVYASIGSKAYLNLIKYLVIDIGLVDFVLHVYIDKNIESSILYTLKKYLDPIHMEVIIHMNMYNGEKDYGVPKSKIVDYSYR